MQTTASSRIKLVQKTFGELEVGDRFIVDVAGGQFLNNTLGEMIKQPRNVHGTNCETTDAVDGATQQLDLADHEEVLVVEVYPVDLKPLFVTMIRDLIEHVDEHDKQKEGQ